MYRSREPVLPHGGRWRHLHTKASCILPPTGQRISQRRAPKTANFFFAFSSDNHDVGHGREFHLVRLDPLRAFVLCQIPKLARHTLGCTFKLSCSKPQPSSCSKERVLHAGARPHLPIHQHIGRDPGLTLVDRWRVRVRPKGGATTPCLLCFH